MQGSRLHPHILMNAIITTRQQKFLHVPPEEGPSHELRHLRWMPGSLQRLTNRTIAPREGRGGFSPSLVPLSMEALCCRDIHGYGIAYPMTKVRGKGRGRAPTMPWTIVLTSFPLCRFWAGSAPLLVRPPS